jgi:hypothetical protein
MFNKLRGASAQGWPARYSRAPQTRHSAARYSPNLQRFALMAPWALRPVAARSPAYIHAYIHAHIHACIHTYMHACMHIHAYISVRVARWAQRGCSLSGSGSFTRRQDHLFSRHYIYIYIYIYISLISFEGGGVVPAWIGWLGARRVARCSAGWLGGWLGLSRRVARGSAAG